MLVKLIAKKDREHIKKNKYIKSLCKYLINSPKLIPFVGSIVNECYNYSDFKKRITELYTEDIHFMSLNQKLINLLFNFYKSKADLGDLRGGLLEYLILKITQNKHKSSSKLLIELSCYIQIEQWKSTKSIDIGAWCCQRKLGDCIECKIDQSKFVDKHIELMKDIKTKSKNNIQTFFVAFSTEKQLRTYIEDAFSNLPLTHISFFGRDSISNMLVQSVV